MPSSARKLPWFLDALRWVRSVSHPEDRALIDLVREDVAQDHAELLGRGATRGQAYRALLRRMRVEGAVFVPRAARWWKARAARAARPAGRMGRRALKPALGVGLAVGLLLAGKVLWFDRAVLDDLADVRQQIGQMQRQLGEAQASLDDHASLPEAADQAISKISAIKRYFESVEQEYPGRFYVAGLVGLVEDDLADYWEAQGDSAKSAVHRAAALRAYERGAEQGDPVALYHLGSWYLGRESVLVAVPLLRKAHERWPLLEIPGGSTTGHVASTYHYALLQQWKLDGNPFVAVDAYPLEQMALRELEHGTTRESTTEILYNAACLRALMVQAGVLDAMEGLRAIELLNAAFDAAGESAVEVARWLESDPDLAGLRDLSAFEPVARRAENLLLEAADRSREGK